MEITETSEPQDLASATAKVLNRLLAEPDGKIALYKILAFCQPARSYTEVRDEILSFPEMKAALQTPQVLLSWLVEAGGLEQITVEGKELAFRTTPAGRNVVHLENPGGRLQRLLAEEDAYRNVFLLVLRSCVAPRNKSEIESILRGNPALENPKVYASFFIEALERAGGLEWNEGWRLTPAGKEFIA